MSSSLRFPVAGALALAAKIEDARRTARSLFGDEYDARAEPWRELVRELCKRWSCAPLQVAPRLEREVQMPQYPLLLIAASADVAEEPREELAR